MFLITENEQNIETLIENTTSGRVFKIEGRFATGDQKNGNGRVYESKVLHPAMNKYIVEKVSQGRGYGQLNHPNTPQIEFERVVMVIESMSQDGSHWNGKAKIINEGLGKIVTAIMEAGGKVGVSTRALGTLREENGIKYVNPDLVFSAIDVVSDPSGPSCWVKGINESVLYEALEDGTIIQLAVDRIVKKSITEEKALKVFSDLMIKLGSK